MAGVVLEDLDLIADPRFYELARFFNLKDRKDRMDHKDALLSVLAWGEKKAKSGDVEAIVKVIRQKERTMRHDASEPFLSALRREIYLDEDRVEEKPKVTKEERAKKKVDRFQEQFLRGVEETQMEEIVKIKDPELPWNWTSQDKNI